MSVRGRSRDIPRRNEHRKPTLHACTLYERSSQQLWKPSIKLDASSWRLSYSSRFQHLWTSLYLAILEKETRSKYSAHMHSNRKRSNADRETRSLSSTKTCIQHTPKYNRMHREFPHLMNSICHSLRFGLMNFQYEQSRNQGKESDLLTFYFTIRFQTNYKETHFLHLRYLYEEVVVTKRSAVKHSFVASSNTEKRTKRIQIACDWHYAEVDKMINAAAANGSSSSKCANSRNVRMALPSHLLIAVFEFVKPSKYLALYSCLATHTDLDAVQVDEMNRRYFHLSNIEWVTNYFGVEPWHFVKLFKVLMEFINHHKVYRYVQEEKQYNQRWRELQIAQREL